MSNNGEKPDVVQKGHKINEGLSVQGGHQPATSQTKPATPPPNQGSGGKKK